MELDINQFIPERLDHRDIIVQKEQGFVVVNANKIRPPRPIRLKSFIKIDSRFIEVIGLYFGDGLNSRTGSAKYRINFCNNCLELHRLWIKFLEKFGLNKSQLYAQIQTGPDKTISEDEIFDYWCSGTGLSREIFQNKISIKEINVKRYGLMVLNFHNKTFRKIFDNIFDYCLDLCRINKNLSRAFLRGLFAAEGHVHLNNYGTLATLEIPVKDKERRLFVKSLLDRSGIESRDSYEKLMITGYLNFKTTNDIKLASLHPNKNHDFEIGYKSLLNSHATKGLTKIRILNLLKKESLTRFEISNKINKGISGIHKSLRDLEYKGLVKRLDKSFSSNNRKLRDVWTLIEIPKDLSILMVRDY